MTGTIAITTHANLYAAFLLSLLSDCLCKEHHSKKASVEVAEVVTFGQLFKLFLPGHRYKILKCVHGVAKEPLPKIYQFIVQMGSQAAY
jgi:hypothetical protein